MEQITTSENIKPFNKEEQIRLSILLDSILNGLERDESMNKTINNLLRHFLWNATAYTNDSNNSPYELQPFWTEKAIRQYISTKYDNYSKRVYNLRHEHSVPIALIKEKIWYLKSQIEIEQLLSNLSIAVVLTKEEDALLNKIYSKYLPDSFNWEKPNIFSRYIECKIGPIYDIRENQMLFDIIACNKKKEFEKFEYKIVC